MEHRQGELNGVGRRLEKGKGGLRMVAIDSKSKTPFEIEEPKWLEDAEHDNCMHCEKKFSFTLRRHHCRRCGRIYCSECCKNKANLQRMSFIDPQRICKDCVHIAKVENLFFTKHLKVLLDGANFSLNDDHLNCECKLSQKLQDKLLFNCIEGGQSTIQDPVSLNDIISIENITEADEGEDKISGIALKVKEQNGTALIKMIFSHKTQAEKKSFAFLEALHQAMKILFDVH